MPRARRRRVWIAAAAVAVGLACCAGGAVAVRSALAARSELHPPRVRVGPLPERLARAGAEAVSFRAGDGVALSGWWLPPRNGAAVIYAHGRGATREQLLPLAEALARHGFGALLLDLRAHGESGGEMSTSGDRERLDVTAAVDLVAARPGVDPGRIAAVGFSIGALAVAQVAIGEPRIRAAVLESMCGSLEEMIRREHRGVVSGAAAVWTLRASGVRVDAVRPGDALCRIAPRRVLLVHGARDREAAPAIGDALRRASCGAAELEIVPGGHGGWDVSPGSPLAERVAAFLEVALTPPPPRRATAHGEGPG